MHDSTSPHTIREFGDPVLKRPCSEITEINDVIVTLSRDMIDTMYAARGVGLAGPQVGVRKQIFVYDAGNGPATVLNPKIEETSGVWTYEEGCLSVPKLYFTFERPKFITFSGLDLDGNPMEFKASEYLARVLQHETDHLNGVLLLDRLSEEERKRAIRALTMNAAVRSRKK